MADYDWQTFITVAEAGELKRGFALLIPFANCAEEKGQQVGKYGGDQALERNHYGLVLTDAGNSLYCDSKFMARNTAVAIQRAREVSHHDLFIIKVAFSLINNSPRLMGLLDDVNQLDNCFQYKIKDHDDSRQQFYHLITQLNNGVDLIAGLF